LLSPVDFLAEWGSARGPLLFLLTGASGAGKTTWCMDLARTAISDGWQVGGFCSPAVFEEGIKTGIDLMDLSRMTRRRLATLKAERVPVPGEVSRDWQFDEQTLAWGNSLLHTAATELLILDELGPLEFEHDGGFQNAFHLLDSRRFKLACVVVRPSLLLKAQDRWPAARLLDLGAENP
jgi:nucleoside-triphosphatase THEP1